MLLVLLLVAVLMARQEEQCYCCNGMVVMLAPRVLSLRWRRSQERRSQERGMLLLKLEVEAAL